MDAARLVPSSPTGTAADLKIRPAASLCSLTVRPRWTGLFVLSGAKYAGMTNTLTILLTSNFPLRAGSNFSIIGLNVSISGDSQFVSVSGGDILQQAVWSASEGRLTLFVTSQVSSASFTVTVQNPPYPREPVLLGAECLGCVSFAPSYRVFNASLARGLGATSLLPSVCGESSGGLALYGSSCQFECYGLVSSHHCVCMSGQFGPGCSQTLGAPAETQTATVSSDKETKIQGSGGLSVVLPAGAVAGSQSISVSVYNVSDLNVSQGATERLVPAGPVLIFSPAGLKFNKYITISSPYDPSLIPAGLEGYLFYYNAMAADPWERQVTTAKPTATPPVLEAQIDHFSGFVPLGAAPPATSPSSMTTLTTTMSTLPSLVLSSSTQTPIDVASTSSTPSPQVFHTSDAIGSGSTAHVNSTTSISLASTPMPMFSSSTSSSSSVVLSTTPSPTQLPSFQVSSASAFNVQIQIISPMTRLFFDSKTAEIRSSIAEGLRVSQADVSQPAADRYLRRASSRSLSYSADLKVDSAVKFVQDIQANTSQTLIRLNVAFTQRNIPNATDFSIALMSSSLSAGAIAGIVIGSVVLSSLMLATIWTCHRARRNFRRTDRLRRPPLPIASLLDFNLDSELEFGDVILRPSPHDQGFFEHRYV
ncbi:hypothetical protein GUITHDRAFT_115989 [Guillardia theta CCMP2712]|uniref:EGF-like domain-containing protein n=2 Tax=Guillardia theta TaxID=55529 RepID=L1IPP8_GUITC|nr:hypothetical protein GUITHDRAFT_115989 [Guillardia theta CCMP2712]EKX37849.1 hypothetical protein GUITHDRAFT_115989 [Guillardia theta CCMP2712]|eukprot:XP_005824829.1 hypothetical protein GUITHDRAFT_115989 [Guillardia theta CCMP2712]